MIKLRYFDWFGAILWMFLQVGYSMVIDRDNILGLAPTLQRLFSAGAIGLFFLFLVWEMTVEEPVLNLSLFKSRQFRHANFAAFLAILSMSSITLLMPFYLQNVRSFSTIQVGLIMTSIPLTMFIFAPIAGRLADTHSARKITLTGLTILTVAIFALGFCSWTGQAGLTINQNQVVIILHLCLVGMGFGIFQSPNSKVILSDVAPENLGMASALLATVRNLGIVTGTALSTMVLMSSYHQKAAVMHESNAEIFIYALRETFLVIAIICAIGIPTVLLSKPKRVT